MQYLENDFAEFWIENGILFFIYKEGVILNLNAAKKIVEDRLKIQQSQTYPVFCDSRGIKDSDKEARDYLAKEGSSQVKAVGVLIGSPLTKLMLNFYLKINKPVTPTQVFTEKGAALKYLDSFILLNA